MGPATALYCKQSQKGILSASTHPWHRRDKSSYKALLHQRSLASRNGAWKIKEIPIQVGPTLGHVSVAVRQYRCHIGASSVAFKCTDQPAIDNSACGAAQR